MEYKKGRLLNYGGKIAVTAPAGPVDRGKLEMAISAIRALGFQIEVGLTCYEKYGGYLAGTPLKRANELNALFANPEIVAIFCLRGGYGTPQLLPLLDYELIAKNPKLFIGYSDITALHIAFQQKSRLATIHGPMPASDLVEADEFTIASLLKVLMNESPIGKIVNPVDEQIACLVPGRTAGLMTGGNLSLITSLMGTPYEIDTCGKILFLEDIDEQPYKIDRMLTQLALAGKFSDANGIVLGTWNGCDSHKDFKVEELFELIIAPFGKPAIYNLRAGHCKPMLTIPLGVCAFLDAGKGELLFKESSVVN